MTPPSLPEPGSPDAPPYWAHETSGVLAEAVEQLLNEPNACTLHQLVALRAYFKLWIHSRAWDMNPSHDYESRDELARLRAQCDGITNVADMLAWVYTATELGMDPL